MYKVENDLLRGLTEKHMQLCQGIKSLVDGGCSVESLTNVLEELCDQSECIYQQSHFD